MRDPHDSSGGPGEGQGALMTVRVMWSLCHDDGSSLVMTLQLGLNQGLKIDGHMVCTDAVQS